MPDPILPLSLASVPTCPYWKYYAELFLFLLLVTPNLQGTNDKSYGAVACFIDQDRDNKNGTGRVISAYTSWYSYSIVESVQPLSTSV